MASRPVVPQQARGDVFVGEGKLQKENVAEGRNRRALGDIGNVVTVRGNDPKNQQAQINRPRTRSFCAQLLANAQKAAPAEKKPINTDKAVVKKSAAPKAGQKKAAAKPKPAEVIEISSDSDEEVTGAQKKHEEAPLLVNKKSGGEASTKKKVTYTSVLTARSKAACGLEKKPKGHIVDIDAADANNDLAAVEYVEDIYRFYKSVENEWRPHDYMHSQPEINEKMRSILLDWLIDVHLRFELSLETLYLTINITDRFLSVKTVPRRELQLVGLSALLMSSKYEEIWPPQVEDLVYIADNAYSNEQILVMEKTILGSLEWYLTVPTHYVFLARFIKASIPDQQMENMVHYLAELGMMHYDILMFSPSTVAASAVYAARSALRKSPVWTDTLTLHTGYAESQLMDCAKLLAYLQSRQQASESKGAVHRKYSKAERCAVALIPPARSLLSGSESAGPTKKGSA